MFSIAFRSRSSSRRKSTRFAVVLIGRSAADERGKVGETLFPPRERADRRATCSRSRFISVGDAKVQRLDLVGPAEVPSERGVEPGPRHVALVGVRRNLGAEGLEHFAVAD